MVYCGTSYKLFTTGYVILCHLSSVLTPLQVKTVHDYRQQVGEPLGRAALALKHKDAEKTFYNLKCLDGEEWTKLLILPLSLRGNVDLSTSQFPRPLSFNCSQSQHHHLQHHGR